MKLLKIRTLILCGIILVVSACGNKTEILPTEQTKEESATEISSKISLNDDLLDLFCKPLYEIELIYGSGERCYWWGGESERLYYTKGMDELILMYQIYDDDLFEDNASPKVILTRVGSFFLSQADITSSDLKSFFGEEYVSEVIEQIAYIGAYDYYFYCADKNYLYEIGCDEKGNITRDSFVTVSPRYEYYLSIEEIEGTEDFMECMDVYGVIQCHDLYKYLSDESNFEKPYVYDWTYKTYTFHQAYDTITFSEIYKKNEFVYFTYDNKLICLDAFSGEKKWEMPDVGRDNQIAFGEYNDKNYIFVTALRGPDLVIVSENGAVVNEQESLDIEYIQDIKVYDGNVHLYARSGEGNIIERKVKIEDLVD